MIASVHAAEWDYWSLNHKVSFDPVLRLITIAPDVPEINIQVDIYSDSKEWMLLRDNMKFRRPMRTAGGDLVPGGDPLGATYFLTNGWRILLDHGVTFVGNLYSDDYPSPFITQSGVQLALSKVSNLVDKVVTSQNVVTGDLASLSIPTAAQTATAVHAEIAPEFTSLAADTASLAVDVAGMPVAVWAKALEGLTAEEMMRVMFAALVGKRQGLPLPGAPYAVHNEEYMAQDGITPRIVFSPDAAGNGAPTTNGAP